MSIRARAARAAIEGRFREQAGAEEPEPAVAAAAAPCEPEEGQRAEGGASWREPSPTPRAEQAPAEELRPASPAEPRGLEERQPLPAAGEPGAATAPGGGARDVAMTLADVPCPERAEEPGMAMAFADAPCPEKDGPPGQGQAPPAVPAGLHALPAQFPMHTVIPGFPAVQPVGVARGACLALPAPMLPGCVPDRSGQDGVIPVSLSFLGRQKRIIHLASTPVGHIIPSTLRERCQRLVVVDRDGFEVADDVPLGLLRPSCLEGPVELSIQVDDWSAGDMPLEL